MITLGFCFSSTCPLLQLFTTYLERIPIEFTSLILELYKVEQIMNNYNPV